MRLLGQWREKLKKKTRRRCRGIRLVTQQCRLGYERMANVGGGLAKIYEHDAL